MSASEPKIQLMTNADSTFVITYQLELLKEAEFYQRESPSNGACWQSLFRNPVIVKGYPISARSHQERGLEIPLNLMAGLGEASRVTNFISGLVVKGFSTLFVPTRKVNNSVQWHYLFEKDGSRISYLAADTCDDRLELDELDDTCLPLCRHFLGWASSAEIHAGKFSSKLLFPTLLI
jgi:hypothetical protein